MAFVSRAGILFLIASTQFVAAAGPVVQTRPAEALGQTGMSVNGSIQPRGMYTTYAFEYGPTTAYGSRTEARPLPPRLAAYYHESWDEDFGHWDSWLKKTHFAEGGAVKGFVRFAEPSRHDHNHDNGIGTVHLTKYFYPGLFEGPPSASLGGGEPDFRDAKISIWARGRDWKPNGSEVCWWTQSQANIELQNRPGAIRPNWAYTGFFLTDYLADGQWHKVQYRLNNDTTFWTYTGGVGVYRYNSIDIAQARLNVDCFHMEVFIDVNKPPTGAIDFDEFEVAYRNYSLLLPSNGGKLVSSPKSADDPARLTDGWRHGAGHVWQSAANPTGPLEFVYAFNLPVTLQTVQIHQNPEWPTKEVEILTSQDGKTFTSLVKQTLPEKGEPNANFAFAVNRGLRAKAERLSVRLLSGYKKEHWGLGEIEVFGSGARMLPDDDLYHVNADLTGLKPGTTYHYRLIAFTDAGVYHGEDRSFTTPASAAPLASTGKASRITATAAMLQGRLNPLGQTAQFYFEYGPDKHYGQKTPAMYGGIQITPRTVVAHLTGLKAATTYHYRLVGVNADGTNFGEDAEFSTSGTR